MNLIARPLLTDDEVGLIERPYVVVMYSRNRPALMKLPDLHKWLFNTALGLGDEEYNTKVREMRNNSRVERSPEEKVLWGIWYDYGIKKPSDIANTSNNTDEFPDQNSPVNTEISSKKPSGFDMAKNGIIANPDNNKNKPKTLTHEERGKLYEQY